MGGFSADWLSLREPCDARSRSREFVIALRSQLPSRPLHAIDLGTGTGANIRYMAPLLGGEIRWLAVDNDATLIEQYLCTPQGAGSQGAGFHCTWSSRQLDLATGLSSLPLSGCQLVTASALLDLVSAEWLASLAAHCATIGAIALFALNYDGRVTCLPSDPDDAWVIDLVNLHQRGDKGFGPALGANATRHAGEVFSALGFESKLTPSDWLIEPDEQALQRELIAGWSDAAHEMAPSEAQRIQQWSSRRIAHLEAGTSRILVGHQDFSAWPRAAGV